MQLKQLIEDVIANSGLISPKVELEERPTGTITGTITSVSFSGTSSAHYMKVIWDTLKTTVPKDSLARIKEITPLTPELRDALDKVE